MTSNIDELNPDEVQALRAELEYDNALLSAEGGAAVAGKTVLVAQGDSWFKYPPGLDLIYWLEKQHNYRIENFAQAGDTVENMVYGTKYSKSNWRRLPPRMNAVEEMVQKLSPKGILLSAGGNDIAGDALDDYFNHASSGLPAQRTAFVDSIFDKVFFEAYCEFIDRVCNAVGTPPGSPGSPMVIGHGYAHAIPDGRGVVNFLGFHWFGPWLRPTFTRKGYDRLVVTAAFVKELIDRLYGMLDSVKKKFPQNFDYVDFRPVVNRSDWVNELHLTNSAYEKCASHLAGLLQTHGI